MLAPSAGMSAGGSDGTADTPAGQYCRQASPGMMDEDIAAEEEGQSHVGCSTPAAELPRKRKGDVEEREDLDMDVDDDFHRSEGEDQQVKMKCFREPHRQIEKRRRDKMNNLIDELSAMIPSCQPMSRKLDKLTVLRKAVQYLKSLKGGTSGPFNDTSCKPSIMPYDDLRQLLLRTANGFLLVVRCDRAKILFISESVSKILNFSQVELAGKSLFDFIHPKDINKVKEQLSSSEMLPRQRLIDASTGVQVHAEAPVRTSQLATGARRSFFCRMKHSRKHEGKQSLPSISKKKDSHRYCTLHCTGYMRSWPSSQLDPETDSADFESSSLNCLVMMCRLHSHPSQDPSKDVNVKATEFVTRCAIDGKFTFVDQQATTVIGYLPQEVLGTSCYEYFHQDDLQHLAAKHSSSKQRQDRDAVLQVQNKIRLLYFSPKSVVWFHKSMDQRNRVHRVFEQSPLGSCSSTIRGGGRQLKVTSGRRQANTRNSWPFQCGGNDDLCRQHRDANRKANSSPSSGASSPFHLVPDKSSQTSTSASSREEEAGNSSQSQSCSQSQSQSQADSRMAADGSSATSETSGDALQLDLDSLAVPGLSSFSSDEAAMAVIMSLLETDANLGQSGDFEDLHWPF
ncbi:basic helix-loop-helix ARNT-like protein 1 isoform X2 [Cololabis saira]|uniref:basic helix-loop-helix ARNT-like protein 1 isoform X2 n=1 Tax=Cololabis saira TaxID=129043 RepID=UPI002AD58AAC|nr:basic helix-loop-helix ARNT-like protein 1 isoform X2 [Cololabis saira]